jgi:hypothetical protein
MAHRNVADRCSATGEEQEVPKPQGSKSSTCQVLPDSPWKRRAHRAATIAVLMLIFGSVALAIALLIALPRARRAAAGTGAVTSAGSCPAAPSVTRLDTSGMAMILEDRFTAFNASTWRYELGDGSIYGVPGYGNGELQASSRVAHCGSYHTDLHILCQ